jgi:transposase
MRGRVDRQQSMFVAFDLEQRIPDDHPLRPIKAWCDRILTTMGRDFNAAYGTTGRVGIPPESLIKCLLLRALFGISSERRLCEACEFNLLYRWFIDRPLDEPMWTPEAFSMNRDRFELHDLVRKFFDRLVAEGIIDGLIGDDRFSVDGTLIRSMAGHKSLKPIEQGNNDDDDLNSWGQFKGQKRSNATHRSVVDPEARLASKGGEAHLRHSMHLLSDAHTGLCVALRVDTADGRAERRNALWMLDHVRGHHRLVPKVVAADAGYGAGEFLCALEARGITPHAALAKGKIVGDSERHRARKRMRRRTTTNQYKISQRLRRMIEPVIGWCKHTGGLGRTRFVGHERIQNDALIVASAWNLMRMVTLRGVM